jgi:hypothetical protein
MSNGTAGIRSGFKKPLSRLSGVIRPIKKIRFAREQFRSPVRPV